MKLFTIGDSISQGFMSLAAAKTELSFSTIIANTLGLKPNIDYAIPTWHKGGLPLNIENLLRKLEQRFQSNIRGPIEWPLALAVIEKMINDVEEHYERGSGNIAMPQAGPIEAFPNVAVRGFTVADAWMVTPNWCLEQIITSRDSGNNRLGLPNEDLARTAHAVLNPSRSRIHGDKSQIAWLKHHAEETGVGNVILWLGSNNALGTILDLKIRSTDNAALHPKDMSIDDRDEYNIWSKQHFEDEYKELLERVLAALERNRVDDWKIFIGTVPAVSVAPLLKGIGRWSGCIDPFGVIAGDSAQYAENYTYVLFDEGFARRTNRFLTRDQVYSIDETIAAYNTSIRSLVQQANATLGTNRLHVVDISAALLQAVSKRNSGKPTYPFPAGLQSGGNPVVNSNYYHVSRAGKMENGGLFSLDGVHPSAIGHGLIALEFLKTMQATSVAGADPNALDWNAIKASDTLFCHPIKLMSELYENSRLAEWLVDCLISG